MVYPIPEKRASLIISLRLCSKTTVIVGSNKLAARRAFAALEANSKVVIVACVGLNDACDEIRWRVEQGELDYVHLAESNTEPWESQFESLVKSLSNVALVCVTDTLIDGNPCHSRSRRSAEDVRHVCMSCNLPLNVTDMPDLCDFTFPSTHRFYHSVTKKATPLQLSITTNGHGCRLAGRIRREVVACLPREVGDATETVGKLRQQAQDNVPCLDEKPCWLNEDEDNSTPNVPVPQKSAHEDAVATVRRRMRWVAQISEYWPLDRLGKLAKSEIEELLQSSQDPDNFPPLDGSPGDKARIPPSSNHRKVLPDMAGVAGSRHDLQILPPVVQVSRGKIYLVGSGPGHPALLTVAAYRVLTQQATLILSDKLVPSQVLALVPQETEVKIAKKFPGNSEEAQGELIQEAVQAASNGEIVVRLKQGDPMLYGRGGEEILYCRQRGFEPIVIPGISSALSGPTLAGIPVTQRGVAESLIVCTGVGRQGKEVKLPGYQRSRTVVILMGVARLPRILATLQSPSPQVQRDGLSYPPYTPIAIIERASMPDQRVIVSTLENVQQALESNGSQRPPGMMLIGWAVLALWGEGDLEVLDSKAEEADDRRRVYNWLGSFPWRSSEGLPDGWQSSPTSTLLHGL